MTTKSLNSILKKYTKRYRLHRRKLSSHRLHKRQRRYRSRKSKGGVVLDMYNTIYNDYINNLIDNQDLAIELNDICQMIEDMLPSNINEHKDYKTILNFLNEVQHILHEVSGGGDLIEELKSKKLTRLISNIEDIKKKSDALNKHKKGTHHFKSLHKTKKYSQRFVKQSVLNHSLGLSYLITELISN